MNKSVSVSEPFDLNNEATWQKFYASLRPLARYLVNSFHISAWAGQEDDLIEDIVQETIRRVIERTRKAERGEAEPIYSLKHIAAVIAQNYCKDLRRAERRLCRIAPDALDPSPRAGRDEYAHPLDEVTEKAYLESLFLTIAHEIARFPTKQRKALLIDLANRMSFDTGPTPLQKAFLNEGIQLRAYQQLLPDNPLERSRHASLLTFAYRRVARLPSVRAYLLAG
jgi:DNA-directed RNA polymerase specialized sigma24 family protein